MKATKAVLGGTLALFTATSALAQTARDEAVCRQWASQHVNWAQAQAEAQAEAQANNNSVGSVFGARLDRRHGAIAGGSQGAAIGAGTDVRTGGARVQGVGDQTWFDAFSSCMSTRRPARPLSARQLNRWELQQWR
jgi:hypothetical protein